MVFALTLAALTATATALPPATPAPAAAASAPAVESPPRRMPAEPRFTLPSPGPNDALIVNSGSTNSAGYSILVHPDGSALVAVAGEPVRNVSVPSAHAKALFDALAAAGPLDALAHSHCMKSASFGTSLHVTYHGHTSSDLSCGAPAEGRTVARAAGDIISAAGIPSFLPRRGQPRLPD